MTRAAWGWTLLWMAGMALGCAGSDGEPAPAPDDDGMLNAPEGPLAEPNRPSDREEPGDAQPGAPNEDPAGPADDGPGEEPGSMSSASDDPPMLVPAIDDPDVGSPSVVIPDPMTHAADADGNYPDLRGRCDIDSGYPGDKACIPPPPEDEGFQIHIGPGDYDDEDDVARFLMEPEGESSECWTIKTPNDEPITYQTAVLSGRDGTHHIINTMYGTEIAEGGFTVCSAATNSIGSLPGASRAYVRRSVVAPENAHIGRSIPANATAQADMHYFNITDAPIIREFWLNIYYAAEEVTEEEDPIRGLGGLGWNSNPIPPGTDQVYKYECPISGDGRILRLLGHYHAQGKRFTASIRRVNGNVDKVFEMYDYLDPAIFDYNTVVENPAFSDSAPGATTGILEVNDGDTLLWECHIQNDLTRGLTYTNEVVGGEMCNIWGSTYGVTPLNCYRP